MWFQRCLIQSWPHKYLAQLMMYQNNVKYITNFSFMLSKKYSVSRSYLCSNINNFCTSTNEREQRQTEDSKSLRNTAKNTTDRKGGSSINGEETNSEIKYSNTALSNENIDEILAKYNIEEFYGLEATTDPDLQQNSQVSVVPLKRGFSGVFDVHEVAKLLNETSIEEICVIRVPPDIKYVQFIIIGTGKSSRHILSVAQQLKSMWKQKRVKRDPQTVHIEGLHSSDWLAIDMGNLALHMFLKETREFYDLESLWACGSEFE